MNPLEIGIVIAIGVFFAAAPLAVWILWRRKHGRWL